MEPNILFESFQSTPPADRIEYLKVLSKDKSLAHLDIVWENLIKVHSGIPLISVREPGDFYYDQHGNKREKEL